VSRSCRVELPTGFGNRWKSTRTNCNTRNMKFVSTMPTPFTFTFADQRVGLAGELGFEPRFSESESDVLPLNYSPTGWDAVSGIQMAPDMRQFSSFDKSVSPTRQ
jgi:hypothetical protein